MISFPVLDITGIMGVRRLIDITVRTFPKTLK